MVFPDHVLQEAMDGKAVIAYNTQTLGWVLRRTLAIAQSCVFDPDLVGVETQDGYVCVAVYPPSDCMGGEEVYEKPIILE